MDTNANRRLEFATGEKAQRLTLRRGEPLVAGLRWDDPWGTACHDFDLALWDNSGLTGTPVAVANDAQTCESGSLPLEILAYTASTDVTDYLTVERAKGEGTSKLELITFNHPLSRAVAAGSLFHPADNPSAGIVTVGAVPWSAPTTLESFSSQGPTTDNRLKPDLVAPDGVSTTSFGAFAGTSAASPHVAGAAALVKAANPSYTPA